jgi:integrase
MSLEADILGHVTVGEPEVRIWLKSYNLAALQRGELRPVRFHDLRHTFGTRMAAQGVPMRAL